LQKEAKSEEGFSLIETSIALVTLAVCLAYAMPLFLYAKINNSKSEIRTGALIVAQRVFDNIRSQPINRLPNNDGKNSSNLIGCTDYPNKLDGCTNNATSPNPVLTPTNVASPSAADRLLTFAMGRQYQTKVIYCEDVNSDATICTDKYRKFKVEVNYNGSKVYDLEGTYTEFD
jgi:Tfp pilus assembly protein PilV